MEFVSLRLLVSIVVADERQVFEGAQVERVLPARRIRLSVGCPPEDDVLDEAGFDRRLLEDRLLGHPVRVGTGPTSITV